MFSSDSRFFIFLLIPFISWFSFDVKADVIEEIVVKGTWRQEGLNQSDGSIVILDQQDLEAQPMKHFEQLSFLVPNLNFAASDSRPRYFQIRGIGERSGYEGTPNSSVGFVIDDIDFSGQGGIATSFDMEQIEVHRGPQGSRMGANALAGLIYIKSKDPTDEFEGHSEINLGSDGISSVGIAFGGPVNQDKTVKYRFAVRQDKMDGFRKNLYLQRSDTSRKDESTGRLKINWVVNDKTEFARVRLLNNKIDDDLLKQILVWYLYRPEDGACSKFGCTKEGARKGVSQEYEKYLQKNIKTGVILLHRSNLVTDKELDTILSTHPYRE